MIGTSVGVLTKILMCTCVFGCTMFFNVLNSRSEPDL